MVTLYVAGQKVGTLADAERLIPDLIAKNQRVELRDENGHSIGNLLPTPPRDPKEPLVPWDPTITQEDLDRISAEPGFTFEEVKKQLGWE
jgi:hypothetical protein